MKLLKTNILLLLLILGINTFAQKITYNYIADSSNVETKKVIELFENYIASNPQNKLQSPFWNSKAQNNHFDFLESEFQPSLYMGFPIHVLSIKSINGLFEIKAQFSYCKKDETPYVLAIVNYYVKKEDNVYKLFNALTINKVKWNSINVGFVDFYFPYYHKFNYVKAKKLNDFITRITNIFDVQPISFEYYFANEYDEVQRLKGIDYYIGMGGITKPSGKASNDKVYCGGLGENYFHEVFHVQIDKHYPNKHFWVSEGVATYLGGSRGKNLQWHITRTNQYLKAHSEIDLNDMLKLKNLDEQTSYHYVLGGLIAKKIYDKGGWNLIKKFMSSGEKNIDYYNAIEKHLGIPKSELNLYLRKQLERESRK